MHADALSPDVASAGRGVVGRSVIEASARIGIAAAASLAVAATGSLTWGALLTANLLLSPRIPWSAPAEVLVLVLLSSYPSGRGGPRPTSRARRELLRARVVSLPVFAWAAVASGLSLVALAGLWTRAVAPEAGR